jgi:acyl transferase domain-containing protein
MACGSNLSLVPDTTALLSALNMMSPDSTCYSFDERANGYSRSEGFGVILMKRLSQAISDGDTIRAVVRSTGCNSDGHTPGITQPSQSAQEQLTRETYQKAGLDLHITRYFEAHGTGTMLGDPTEARAISNAFPMRTTADPIYVGALKSNIGHPESASGIAGVIKTILVLEAGVIPPNRYPERINPVIASSCTNLSFPLAPIPWPTKNIRRASVSSFGYGGTNVHVVMDDVASYIKSRKLRANHRTRHSEKSKIVDCDENGTETSQPLCHDETALPTPEDPEHNLLVLSAFDEYALQRSTSLHGEWLRSRIVSADILADLAFTLASKRSTFPWRTFSIASGRSATELSWSSPIRAIQDVRICFIFTGQGAQYHGMGRELFKYESFRKSVTEADVFFKTLGSEWSLSGTF